MRLGIYGGSFDPIHLAHVEVVAAVRAARGLDRVELVVAGRPPHKPEGCLAPFEDRVAMVRLAIRGRPGLAACDLEGLRPGPSFTVDTVADLHRREPSARLELLVGADMLEDLPRWRRARELLAGVEVVAFARPGWPLGPALEAFRSLSGALPSLVEVPALDVRSSEIRRRLAEGLPVEGLLAPEVLAYIRKRGLYGAESGG